MHTIRDEWFIYVSVLILLFTRIRYVGPTVIHSSCGYFFVQFKLNIVSNQRLKFRIWCRWYTLIFILKMSNSLVPWRCACNRESLIFKFTPRIYTYRVYFLWNYPQLNAARLRWWLVHAMPWCHQATSHYIYQSWLRSISSYGVTRPQWFRINKTLRSIHIIWWRPLVWSFIKSRCSPENH